MILSLFCCVFDIQFHIQFCCSASSCGILARNSDIRRLPPENLNGQVTNDRDFYSDYELTRKGYLPVVALSRETSF
jgi:hypothetical protein